MSDTEFALLDDRGVVRVTGGDATAFLDNLVTNDVTGMAPGTARFAALLTPQGKILFDFLVVRTADGYLLDVTRDKSAELVKRLTLYKLRAKVAIDDVSAGYQVGVAWRAAQDPIRDGALFYEDPRSGKLGFRFIAIADYAPTPLSSVGKESTATDYHARRIALGIPEGGKDYAFGDAFPHEANMDRLDGVSFTKGCFVGQEVVSRMQHKTVVRKRVTRVEAAGPLTSGAEVKAGDAVIGTIGSVSENQGLAMLRLDRVIEALDKGQAITADGHTLTVDPDAVRHFRDESTAKAAEKAARI